jgi:hypothetical protein
LSRKINMCNTTSDGGRGRGRGGGSSLDSVGLKKRGVETDMEAGTSEAEG